jgi:hypothetical protein
MELCSSCSDFDLHSFSLDRDQMRGYRYKDVAIAAGEGCRFCSLLFEIAGEENPRDSDWLHLQISEDSSVGGSADAIERGLPGLRYNTISIVIGTRFQRIVQHEAKYCRKELCVLADTGERAHLRCNSSNLTLVF